ncbi:MAG TPA: RluA family pseudouridine synthase [Rectinemataceae bacterium]
MLKILYEDDEILVIDKPAGLPAQPGAGVTSSVVSVTEKELGIRPFLVHRLDKETCGCMLLAKSSAAASRFSALLQDPRAGKTYYAICSGSPRKAGGVYDEPLGRNGDEEALTEYRLLAQFGSARIGRSRLELPWAEGFSLLCFRLRTGRMHQIRRHCSIHGHPILGDDKYGDFRLNRSLKKEYTLRHILLWAKKLEVPGFLSAVSPLPDHFKDFFSRFPDAPNPEDY